MQIRTISRTAVLVVALLFASLGLTQTVSAVEGESITLSPSSKPYKLKAGETIKDSLIVINDGTIGYNFKVYTTPYSVKNSSYEPDYLSSTATSDVQTWVRFDQQTLYLEPGARTEITYTINVPTDAAPGGHYGVLFAETQPTQGQQIARKKRVGAIVYATIDGQYVQAGKEIRTNLGFLQIGGTITGQLTVENTGNTDFTMTNGMTIKNVFGAEVYKQSNERIILPKTTRDIPIEWANGAQLGLYRVQAFSEILGKKTNHDQWVLVAPVWFLAVSLVMLGLIIFGIVRRFR